MHFADVNECVTLLARRVLRCLENWICSCWLVPWMLIFVVNIKCPPPQCLFLEGYLANEMMICVYHTVAAAWAFSESFWTLQRLRHSQQLEKCSMEVSTAASCVVLNKRRARKRVIVWESVVLSGAEAPSLLKCDERQKKGKPCQI